MQKAFYLIKKILRTGWPLLVILGTFLVQLNFNALSKMLPSIFSTFFLITFMWISSVAALLSSFRYYKQENGSIIAVILAICCTLGITKYKWCILISEVYQIYKTPLPSGILLISNFADFVTMSIVFVIIFIALCPFRLKRIRTKSSIRCLPVNQSSRVD